MKNNELIQKFKLFTNYNMGKTLTENINEQTTGYSTPENIKKGVEDDIAFQQANKTKSPEEMGSDIRKPLDDKLKDVDRKLRIHDVNLRYIAQLQKMLKDNGFNITVDGIMGPKTMEALKSLTVKRQAPQTAQKAGVQTSPTQTPPSAPTELK